MIIRGTHDDATIAQLQRCIDAEPGALGILCADGHKGYSMPIGGVVAYKNFLSPSGVGYDIACGNMAVKLDVKLSDVPEADIRDIALAISREVSFGVGRKNPTPVQHEVLDRIADAPIPEVRALHQKAAAQLGTVGSGNHYVDVLVDPDGHLWVAVHFGSRGFGHTVATGFLRLAQGKPWDSGSAEGEMDSPPVLIASASPLGEAYWYAMELAGQYAYAGRETVIDTVTKILGSPKVLSSVHNHHNFTWRERHLGSDYYVVRKGATPAAPGQYGFIGGSMGDISVIVRGMESDLSRDLLYSTVHGAGRVMSRTQAAGKRKKEKSSWNCSCGFTAAGKDFPYGTRATCPTCGGTLGWKKGDWQARTGGVVDFAKVKEAVRARGTILIGAGADEAPEVYRPLRSVLEAHSGTIEVVTTLTPIIVVMAGPDEFDPYKD